jgi:hypothetical protein
LDGTQLKHAQHDNKQIALQRSGSRIERNRIATKREDEAHRAKEEHSHRVDGRLTEQKEIALTEQVEIELTERKRVAQSDDKRERKGLTEPQRRHTNKVLTGPDKESTAQGDHRSKDSKHMLRVKGLHNLKRNNQPMMLTKGNVPWRRSLAMELNKSSITSSDNPIGV